MPEFNCTRLSKYRKIDGSKIQKDDIVFLLKEAKKEVNINDKKRTIIHIFNHNYIVDGKISISDIKDLSIEDLLSREQVQPNIELMSKNINSKVVLVTGAGGSIGSELVRNCLSFDPGLLILLDQSEHNLFKIDRECQAIKTAKNLQTEIFPILGDIRDSKNLEFIFTKFEITEGNYLISGHLSIQFHVLLFYKPVQRVIDSQKELAEILDNTKKQESDLSNNSDQFVLDKLKEMGYKDFDHQKLFEICLLYTSDAADE